MKNVRNTRIMAAASMLLVGAAPSLFASNVLPSSDQPMGYSLATLAQDTAVYNTGVFAGNSPTANVPNVPFQILEGDTAFAPNTYIYLPIFFADDSGPADPAFPTDVSNQQADAAYLDNLVLSNYGVTSFFAQVDGQNIPLDDSYITGVTTSPLPDGSPEGTHYISIAAIISPLSVGEDHTVGFGGVVSTPDGPEDVTFGLFNVPEPTGLAWVLATGSATLMRRRKHL